MASAVSPRHLNGWLHRSCRYRLTPPIRRSVSRVEYRRIGSPPVHHRCAPCSIARSTASASPPAADRDLRTTSGHRNPDDAPTPGDPLGRHHHHPAPPGPPGNLADAQYAGTHGGEPPNRSVIPWKQPNPRPATLHGHLAATSQPGAANSRPAAQGVLSTPVGGHQPQVTSCARSIANSPRRLLRRFVSHAVPEGRRRPGDRQPVDGAGRGRAVVIAHTRTTATILGTESGRPFPRRTRRHRQGASPIPETDTQFSDTLAVCRFQVSGR